MSTNSPISYFAFAFLATADIFTTVPTAHSFALQPSELSNSRIHTLYRNRSLNSTTNFAKPQSVIKHLHNSLFRDTIASVDKAKTEPIITSPISSYSSIPNPNVLNLEGPNVTLVFKRTQAKQAFEYMAKIGGYGFVWVQNDPTYKHNNQGQTKVTPITDQADQIDTSYVEPYQPNIDTFNSDTEDGNLDSPRLITLTLNNKSYTEAFNALLIASGLQAKFQDGILYVGPNVRNVVFTSRYSSVYLLNQVSSSSAADYLANLGASVTKTFTISTSVTEGATKSDSVEGGSSSSTTTQQTQTSVNVYGATIGPLVGLVATTDERLQTVTLVGEQSLVELAARFLKGLDQRQLQVALNVRILDVNLTDSDSFTNSFAFRSGESFIVSEAGNIVSTIGKNLPALGAPIANPGLAWPQQFVDQLSISLKRGTTKVLASPTLILSEYSGPAGDGNIGRKFGNEGFVEIGDKVPINAEPGDGSFCTLTYDLVGIKLGARILGIDNSGYVTFTMSPEVTGVTSTLEIPGCGTIRLLNTRRVDTGSIRVKNGDTLILTGVLQDSEIESFTKLPLLGDLPVLGSLFKSTDTQIERRELVILVTPKIINDSANDLNSYGYNPTSKTHKDLLNSPE